MKTRNADCPKCGAAPSESCRDNHGSPCKAHPERTQRASLIGQFIQRKRQNYGQHQVSHRTFPASKVTRGCAVPPRRFSPDLVDTLRATLRQLEETVELEPDDPTLEQLKRSILLALADLEWKKRPTAA